MIKRLFRLLFLLALAVGCYLSIVYGMPALEKLTPSKTSTASTATPAPASVLASPPDPSPTASMIPSDARIWKAVVVPFSLSVWAEPGIVENVTPVAWLYIGAEVIIDECQHGWGWAHLAGGPGWVRSKWLDPDVCAEGKG